MDSVEDVGRSIQEEWQAVFIVHTTDEDAKQCFLAFFQEGSGNEERVLEPGATRAAVVRMPRSSPCPDWVPYSLWATAPDESLDVLESTIRPSFEGSELLAEVLKSYTIPIPKGEYQPDMDRIIRRLCDLRPITLRHMSAELIASIVRGGSGSRCRLCSANRRCSRSIAERENH